MDLTQQQDLSNEPLPNLPLPNEQSNLKTNQVNQKNNQFHNLVIPLLCDLMDQFQKHYDLTLLIIIKSNLGEMLTSSFDILKYLNVKTFTYNIDLSNRKIVINITFNQSDQQIFYNIINILNINGHKLLSLLHNAYQIFGWVIKQNNYKIFKTELKKLYRADQIWHDITNYKDYNLYLFEKRKLPYFNIENKEWTKANIDAIKNNYPTQIIKKKNIDEEKIREALQEKNNFLKWPILPIKQYPNLQIIIQYIKSYYDIGLKKQSIIILLYTMLNPKECHIIKCPEIWRLFMPYIKQNQLLADLIRYCFIYAQYILRQEETIMWSQINLKYRVLFTLEEAASMPIFNIQHPDLHPYILQLTGSDDITKSMPFYLVGPRYINSIDEFYRRFHLATAGAFKNIDLKSLGAAITGSILIPCVHRNPLEQNFANTISIEPRSFPIKYPYMIETPDNTEDIQFLNYLEYYYPGYASLTDTDYQQQVLTAPVEKSVINNISIMYEDDVFENSIMENSIMKNHLEKKINTVDSKLDIDCDSNKTQKVAYNQLADIDISITTKNIAIFYDRVKHLYEQIKKNCEHRGPVYIKKLTTMSSIKYKIYGPGLSRPMDIFHIPYEPAKMVKKFHVNAVKMYYNGELTLFRACVACLLSGVSDSYQWFSCNKIPIDVLLKYAQRGISIILNKIEKDASSQYLSTDDRWAPLLKNIHVHPSKIFCCVDQNHAYFRPGDYLLGIRKDLRDLKLFKNDLPPSNSMSIQFKIPNLYISMNSLQNKNNYKYYPPNYDIINQWYESANDI